MVLRTDEMGIAMTEGIIVVPFFIVAWMGLFGMYNMYQAKLRAQTLASAAALNSAAVGNCSDIKIEHSDMEGTEQIDEVSKEQTSVLSRIGGVNPLAIAHSSARATEKAKLFDKEVEMKGERMMACNSRPADSLMELIVDNVKAFFDL